MILNLIIKWINFYLPILISSRIYLEHKTWSGAVFRTYLQPYSQESKYCEPCAASSLSAWKDRLGGQVRWPPVGVSCETPQHCSMESMQVPWPWEMSTDVYFYWVLEEICSSGYFKSKNHLLFSFLEMKYIFLASVVHSADIWVGLYKVLNKLFAKVSSIWSTN